jgi:hypothetical protein
LESIIVSSLNILGLTSQSLVISITLAVLGLLAITSLVNRYKTEETLEKVSHAQKEVFLYEFPPDWQSHLENCYELWVLGINLARTVTSYFSLFEKKLKRGDKIKVLLVDPNSQAVQVSAIRRPQASYSDQNRTYILTSLESFCELKANSPDNLEIRIIDYPLSFSIFGVDPYTANGILYLSYYPYKTPGGTIPRMMLQSKNGRWYDHFREEMQNLWDNALPWGCERIKN